MRSIRVEGLNREVSCISLGTAGFGDLPEATVMSLLDAFVAAGGNCIDVAHVYGNGLAEERIGNWMQARNNRDRIILVGKGCHPDLDGQTRVSPAMVQQDLTESLARLQSDWIDLYMLHRDNPAVPVELLLDALNHEVVSGRISAYGLSNWRSDRIKQADSYAQKRAYAPIAASSSQFSLARPGKPFWFGGISANDDDLQWHSKTQTPLFAWSAQARGFFAKQEPKALADNQSIWGTHANFERLRRARVLATTYGIQAHHIALAFVLCQPFPTVAIIGVHNLEHLGAALQASQIELTSEHVDYLASNGVP